MRLSVAVTSHAREISRGTRPMSGDSARGTEKRRRKLTVRNVRIRDGDNGPCVSADDQRDVDCLDSERAATMDMHVRARLIVVRSGIAIIRILVQRGVVLVPVAVVVPMVIVRRVRMNTVNTMRVGIECGQDACISVHATDADCGSNDDKTQKLADQMAHSLEKPEDSRRVKPSE